MLTACFADKANKRFDYTDHALNISFAKDASMLLVSHTAGYIDLNEIQKDFKPKKLNQWAHQQNENNQSGIIASDFSKDKQFIVTVEQTTIARYSVAEKKVVNFWSLDNISDVKISALGDFALVASAEEKNDQYGKYLHYRIVYFHLPTGKIKYALYHDDIISTVALSDDGQFALSGSDDGKARLWDLKTGELKFAWEHDSKLTKVQLSADGRFAMTNNAAGDISIWLTDSGKLYRRFKYPKTSVSAAAFSEDGKYLLTGLSREKLVLWDIKGAKIFKKWHIPRRYFGQSALAKVISVAFEDDKYLVSVTSRGISQRWKYR